MPPVSSDTFSPRCSLPTSTAPRRPTVARGAPVSFVLAFLLPVALVPAANAASVVDAVSITVSDLSRAVRFYSDVLDFEPTARWEVSGDAYEHASGVFGARIAVVRMGLGEQSIELTEYLAPRGRPIPTDTQSNDGWFQHVAIVVSDIDEAYARLRAHRVEHASSGPQTLPDWNPNAGGISAFYFRDPDGNHLEILEFPSDKGDARWHTPSSALFRGIDHTAIVVADTERSLAFYRDTLGFSIVGTSENYGVEQEHLNNVFGARLRITTLRADAGPGVELLEYLAPRTGREMPDDTRGNDLWSWQINILDRRVATLSSAVRAGGYRYVSTGVVDIPEPSNRSALLGPPKLRETGPVLGGHDTADGVAAIGQIPASADPDAGGKVLVVRDPDGHALKLVDRRAH